MLRRDETRVAAPSGRPVDRSPASLIAASLVAAALLAAPAFASAAPAVTSTAVNLRAGPDSDYPLVGWLPEGTPVQVQGCLPDYRWCDVIVQHDRGWVHGRYLAYYHENRYAPILGWGAVIGLPLVGFTIGSYWDDYYRQRPWYRDRPRWERRHYPAPPAWNPPSRPPEYRPPMPRPPIERPPGYRPPSRIDSRPDGRPPEFRPPAPLPAAPRPPSVRPPDTRPGDWRGDGRGPQYQPPQRAPQMQPPQRAPQFESPQRAPQAAPVPRPAMPSGPGPVAPPRNSNDRPPGVLR